jgi:hypothetical protein
MAEDAGQVEFREIGTKGVFIAFAQANQENSLICYSKQLFEFQPYRLGRASFLPFLGLK